MRPRSKVSKHKLWLACDDGSFVDGKPLKVTISDQQLRIAHHLTVDLSEIASCQLRSINGSRANYIELLICSPSLNRGEPTPVYLLYPGFWPGRTKDKRMQPFVDEMAPLIAANHIDTLIEVAAEAREDEQASAGRIQLNYALAASFTLAGSRWQWFSFDRPRIALVKTYYYMYLSAILNSLGILIVLLPRFNWIMSENIEILGGSRRHRVAVYVSTLLLPPGIWAWVASLYM